jgi:alkanesulfonate monooxygenase SsuD/methylene tetrahydromethanopterin reductase-like flavin-dependent oxidoreductase (luciferase family)
MFRVAVNLRDAPGRIGDYLADVTALEAAGTDSIWLDTSTEASIEPWILLGAIAAVTHRVRLGIRVGSAVGLPVTVDTLTRLSDGRVVLGLRPGREPGALVKELKVWGAQSPSSSKSNSSQQACELPGSDGGLRSLLE